MMGESTFRKFGALCRAGMGWCGVCWARVVGITVGLLLFLASESPRR